MKAYGFAIKRDGRSVYKFACCDAVHGCDRRRLRTNNRRKMKRVWKGRARAANKAACRDEEV